MKVYKQTYYSRIVYDNSLLKQCVGFVELFRKSFPFCICLLSITVTCGFIATFIYKKNSILETKNININKIRVHT